jgi:two-component system CheB/CheR fusion protein
MINDNDAGRDGAPQREQGAPQKDDTAGEPVIVAIGASAGGVQALQAMFGAMADNTGAAFVIVVHLDPGRRSELTQIIAARTRMPVVQVEDRTKLKANHVYVIPPDRGLELTDHQISTVGFTEPRGHRSPIDQFFRSVAERLGDGFAIILSGAGSDGAIGVRAVKEAGGIILVQDPVEAEYTSMPRSAIATGVADFVLPVRELARHLGELLALKRNPATRASGLVDEEVLRRILAHLRVRTGHDFSKYKRSTILRRIARRMQVTRTAELKEYYDFLRENGDEAQALLGDLLISVTTFFRDGPVFETLAKTVIPELFKDKGASEPIRVWVCGCATGEEAYTLAILLLEAAARHEIRPPIQVFASDLDSRALAAAREGRFPAAIESDVSKERLDRFFAHQGDFYRVRQEVRDIVLFSMHDVLKDPPFSHIDLISCRNVLIYLDRDLQEQVCSTFHYALSPGGFLLVGSSETADNPPGLFRSLDRQARVYQSATQAGDRPRLLPRLLGPVRMQDQVLPPARGVSPTAALGEAALHRRAIEQVAPPSILVDETHRVMHLSDNAGRFLLLPGGPLSGDLADLARPELRFELRSSLHRAFEQKQPTLSLPIPVQFNGAAHRVHLLVKPLAEDDGPRSAVVMFIEGDAVEESTHSGTDRQAADDTVRRLSQELELTQSRLRTVREESEAANEELRAANEELQSINEEYRSTSEELETSKEELQSINEELQTVNSELKSKLDTISRAHSDLQNLMAATDVGTLFLDTGLHIKRFTDRVTDLFSITPADEGRPITDFTHRLDYDDLIKDARTVLSDLVPIRREVRSHADRWYDVRLRPYRTVDNKIDGVVATFLEITERRAMEQALRASEQRLLQEKRLMDLSREPIFVWDFDGGIVEWNRGSEELYGYSRDEALGQRKDRLLGTKVPGASFESVRKSLAERGSWSGELVQRTKGGRELTVDSRIELVSLNDRRLAFESTRDISERKQWETRQRLLLGELTHRVKNTLAVIQAIARQTLRASKSNEDFIEHFDGRLAALSRAHGLLVESEWRGANLVVLARQELEPYTSERPDRLHLDGPAIILPPDLATPVGLVLHELATNSTKYGSLSRPKGTVNLHWSLADGNAPHALRVVWKEQGGPAVETPTRSGFGSLLIESSIPAARVHREFRPEGLVCTIELPLPRAADDGNKG